MKKSVVFALTAVLLSCLLLSACGTSIATKPATVEKPLELNFSYTQPAMSGVAKIMLKGWADDLEKACGGRIKIIHHPGATLVPGPQALDAVISGMCDIAAVSPGEVGRLPRCEIMNLPYLFPSTEIAGVAYHEFLNKYCADTELKDVKILYCIPNYTQDYIGKKPVQKMEDFKGLKLRAGGKWDSATMEALGATPVVLSTSDAYSALDTGVVDGTLFAFEGALALGFWKVTKYRTDCNIFQSVFPVVMNKDSYATLPDDIKKIFDDFSSLETTRKYSKAWSDAEAGAIAALTDLDIKAGNSPIYVLPPDEVARWKQAEQPVSVAWIAEMNKQGLPGQEMYNAILDIVKKYSK